MQFAVSLLFDHYVKKKNKWNLPPHGFILEEWKIYWVDYAGLIRFWTENIESVKSNPFGQHENEDIKADLAIGENFLDDPDYDFNCMINSLNQKHHNVFKFG